MEFVGDPDTLHPADTIHMVFKSSKNSTARKLSCKQWALSQLFTAREFFTSTYTQRTCFFTQWTHWTKLLTSEWPAWLANHAFIRLVAHRRRQYGMKDIPTLPMRFGIVSANRQLVQYVHGWFWGPKQKFVQMMRHKGKSLKSFW